MTPDEARAVANAVGMQLKNEWQTTAKVIAAVPDGNRDYKPDPNGRSAWDLATHMAGADVWFLDGVLNGKFADITGEEQPPAPTAAGVAEWYSKEFPNRIERVLALPDDKLTQIIDFFGMKMPAVQFMMFALVHMVHHRGQLSSYLRPMGGKVPSIYGGSYDEPWQGSPEANS
jgi:uncharacterized damage-inducible protein DinB